MGNSENSFIIRSVREPLKKKIRNSNFQPAARMVLMLLFLLSVCTAVIAADEQIPESLRLMGMVYDESGENLTLVSPANILRMDVDTGRVKAGTALTEDDPWSFISASENGIFAALSKDRKSAGWQWLDEAEKGFIIEPEAGILSAMLSPDGKYFIVNSADEIRTVIYDTESGKTVYDLTGFGTAAPVYDASLSRDGKHLLWHSRGTFALQDAETGSFGEYISLWDFAASSALSADSKVLAVGIINEDYGNGTVIFFDPQSGKELYRTILGQLAPNFLSFSADGTVLLAADKETVYRIDPKTGKITAQFTMPDTGAEEDRITCIAVSPDGSSAFVQQNQSGQLIRLRMDENGISIRSEDSPKQK